MFKLGIFFNFVRLKKWKKIPNLKRRFKLHWQNQFVLNTLKTIYPKEKKKLIVS